MYDRSGVNGSGSDSFTSKTSTSESLPSPVSSAKMTHFGGPRWGSARSPAAAAPGFLGYGLLDEDGYGRRPTSFNVSRPKTTVNEHASSERSSSGVQTKFGSKPIGEPDAPNRRTKVPPEAPYPNSPNTSPGNSLTLASVVDCLARSPNPGLVIRILELGYPRYPRRLTTSLVQAP